MNLRALFWGLLFITAALVLGLTDAGRLEGGPRIGLAVGFGMFGLMLILMANAAWFLRKTTRPEDYEGTCPVGESCKACGAFNFKPRQDCRSCKGPVNRDEDASDTA